MKILLVEDSRPIQLQNERVLLQAGYEVTLAGDGKAALLKAKTEKPDLILLDLMLPVMSGLEVLRHLKNNPATGSIPVVVLSGLSDRNGQKLIEEGAEAYLGKNDVMPDPEHNTLPQVLQNIICAVNRRKGIAFSTIPIPK